MTIPKGDSKKAKEIILRTLDFHSEKSYPRNVLLAMVQDVAGRVIASQVVDVMVKSRLIKFDAKTGLFSSKNGAKK